MHTLPNTVLTRRLRALAKRTSSAYLIFVWDFYQKNCREGKPIEKFTSLMQLAAEEWLKLNDSAKLQYQEMAQKNIRECNNNFTYFATYDGNANASYYYIN